MRAPEPPGLADDRRWQTAPWRVRLLVRTLECLRGGLLAGMCVLPGLGAGIAQAQEVPPESGFQYMAVAAVTEPQDGRWSPMERALLKLTSDYRAHLGLGRWQPDERLQALARSASERMASERRASHDGFQARFERSGAYLCVEVIARGRFTPEIALALWRRSPDHHRNLVEPRARWVGVSEVGGYATLFACDQPGR